MPYFIESESIKRLFSKFLRGYKTIPSNLSDEEIQNYLKEFYKVRLGFLRITSMATDPWNEPWPYIVHNEECQRGWNLYGDKSDDETTGLLCGNDLGGSNVSISLVISNETSKSAWNAIRKTLTEEINAALEKSNEETLKKQKKDM